jgi:uncharacterized protein with FMN-binding domain
MRRSVFAIIGTVAGTALMLGAKLGTPPPDDPAAFSNSNSGDPAAAGDPSDAASPTAPGSAGAPASTPPAGAPSPAVSGSAPASGPVTPKPTPTTNPPTSGLKDGKFAGTGATVPHYRYTMTVSITVSGGRITAASYDCGDSSGESRSICQGRASKLVQETLAAQSANVATVSGATYSTQAYKSSLQSAIDRAKV